MINPEELEKYKANFLFFDRFRNVMRERTADIHPLRILDYGAGQPHTISLFATIQFDQAPVFAYDPSMSPQEMERYTNENTRQHTNWSNELPATLPFDLVIFHFSMHHMGQPIQSVIAGLAPHSPRAIALSDYDYTPSSSDIFARTFIAEQELKELQTQFKGDLSACFDYHKRLGIADYTAALEVNGYTITHTEKGIGVAEPKFFLVGEQLHEG